MMMTCRLLCALLVLALCCCPSVCVARDTPVQASSQMTTNSATQASTDNKKVIVQPDGKGSSSFSSATVGLQGKDQSEESLALVPVGDKGTKADAGPGAPTPEKQSKNQNNVVNAEGKKSTTESQSGTSSSPENEDNKAEDAPTKTTTTTQAPNKTTTTTTTAPEAPSTTTTETPTTTTTTRAPSRLREIDGSLSSSAWVCAPLLLAVSALAYTALG
ncbi:putative mucin TcMUCII [Trypanosoma cruzi]|uniref:Mucin TcMUCII, putative n=2 Tax=Trypanosoma cruzi TaxID=5693 RepID=Q4CVM7_TRYCC|nr:mucin TcMUCII, putative [Trypanosoma cruzi]EAN84329.1 mucin TcMUCII, putative [Trypanosoma cruzi]PWV14225.1 putative mucin TcMUCII [Trypanosoma cruzi]RNC40637.1 mucin TcMUCII [Trypanosoma cruzi]|eukprot:XP_806180.1 mucin TcMUCII [Trypanosoma cruzi strain CL Brener]